MGWSTSPDALDIDSIVDGIKEHGYAIVPNVLSKAELEDGSKKLWEAVEEQRQRPRALPHAEDPTYFSVLHIMDFAPFFAELLEHPVADAILSRCLGVDYIVSTFNAKIARPGNAAPKSAAEGIHCDVWRVTPEPWANQWALNIMWCLSDMRFENGATLHMPGSHRFERYEDVPADINDHMVPFEAPAGSIIAMDGKMWHGPGANVTKDEDRPLLLAYYFRSFLRPQTNYSVVLRPEVQNRVSPKMRYRLGLDSWLNIPLELRADLFPQSVGDP